MKIAYHIYDYNVLPALYNHVRINRRTDEQIIKAFQSSRYVAALYDDDQQLIGAARAIGDEVDCAVICDVAIYKPFQNQGYGSQLVKAIVQQTRHHQRIMLLAMPDQEQFYEKLGFSMMRTAMMTSYLLTQEQLVDLGFITTESSTTA